mgnify:CR=1 FL=1
MKREGLTPKIYRDVLGEPLGNVACLYCGFHATEVDHIVPFSRGGAERDPDNLAPACFECNSEKSDMTLQEWQAARTSSGKTWPVTNYADRLLVVAKWARPVLDQAKPPRFKQQERLRALLMDMRDVDVADLL